MVNSCCVAGCKNESYPGSCFSFHGFPNNENQKMKWENVVPGKITKSSVVCSAHFKCDDFIPGYTRKMLKADAVPSIFPKTHSSAQNVDPENLAEVVTVEDSNADDARSGSHISEDLVSDTDSIFDTPLVATLKTELKLSLQKNKKYRSQIHMLQKKSKYFKSKTTMLRIVVKQLRNKIEVFNKIIAKLSENAKKARRD